VNFALLPIPLPNAFNLCHLAISAGENINWVPDAGAQKPGGDHGEVQPVRPNLTRTDGKALLEADICAKRFAKPEKYIKECQYDKP
jgi:hypothetical protein